ncbi:MAG TPA: beta-L-arabinofuranosidase domain-containing protein [Puia sp.]|nr:beta-L-arabinofuranosidase domain-containing protein [Puia sp.]
MTTRLTISLTLLLAAHLTALAWQHPAPVPGVEQPISPTAVTHVGGFAGNRIEKNKDHYLKTFDIAKYVGLMETRTFTGWDWRQGEQPGKWLESAILSGDPGLEKEARLMLGRLIRSQAPDGYIGITSPTVRTSEKPLGGMDAYELYFLQHALLTAYEQWKDRQALTAAKRLGDYFVHYIGPGKAEFWPSPIHYPENREKTLKGTMHSDIAGHSIHYSWEGTLLIDPMMRLYQLTGDKRYYGWCKWVVNSIDKWSGWDAYSNLDKVAAGTMPIDKIQPYVHAHTFQMNFLGLLRMYRVSGDSSYLRKVEGAWNDIASRQLYITGGVSVGEHYERDFVKPLTGEMMETCATMSWMQLSQELLDIIGDPKYADAIERIQWNNVFAEQTIDGDANHYFTPPNGYTPKGYYREPDCCMSSGERLLSMLPGFIYAGGAQDNFYINQFIPSTTTIGKITVIQQTNFPESGAITILLSAATPTKATINIRIPAWCTKPALAVNDQPVAVQPGTYARITRSWRKGDKITLDLPLQLQWVRHDHYQQTADRKPYKTTPDDDAPYALVRGPVVYAVDDIWYNGDTADFHRGWMDSVRYLLTSPAQLKSIPAPDSNILGPGYELTLMLSNGNKANLPVYPFANIGKWYRDPAHKPDSNAAAWTYAIWLKGQPANNGALKMPHIFGDNMVLQREAPVPVWGNARPGATVTVSFNDQRKTTTTDPQGHWRLTLDPLEASANPATLLVSSEDGSIQYRNILVGEVWLCSGQSNMEYPMRRIKQPDTANNPDIRIFLVRNNYSKPDEKNIRRVWDPAIGTPLRDFSAPAYFFAKELYATLHIPIGVISNAIPGSRIEPWLPDTGKFYTNIVHPLAPYAIRGFCWYQGESNCFLSDTLAYAAKMTTLINSWRHLWETPAASFYLVQITPYEYSKTTHSVFTEPAFWEAQQKALTLPHTGMIVTTDLVDSITQLHPMDKWTVGHRLALLALANDYHQQLTANSPTFQSMSIKGRTIQVKFINIGGGLVSHDGQAIDWFETADKNGKFTPATATITGPDTVTLTAKNKPIAVRFGWSEAAQPNLYNKEGLPAMPFRASANQIK